MNSPRDKLPRSSVSPRQRPLPATLQSTAPANTDDTLVVSARLRGTVAPTADRSTGRVNRSRSLDDTRQPLCPVAESEETPQALESRTPRAPVVSGNFATGVGNYCSDTDGGSDSSAAYSRSESVTSASRPPRSYSSRQMMVRKRSRSTWQTFVAAEAQEAAHLGRGAHEPLHTAELDRGLSGNSKAALDYVTESNDGGAAAPASKRTPETISVGSVTQPAPVSSEPSEAAAAIGTVPSDLDAHDFLATVLTPRVLVAATSTKPASESSKTAPGSRDLPRAPAIALRHMRLDLRTVRKWDPTATAFLAGYADHVASMTEALATATARRGLPSTDEVPHRLRGLIGLAGSPKTQALTGPSASSLTEQSSSRSLSPPMAQERLFRVPSHTGSRPEHSRYTSSVTKVEGIQARDVRYSASAALVSPPPTQRPVSPHKGIGVGADASVPRSSPRSRDRLPTGSPGRAPRPFYSMAHPPAHEIPPSDPSSETPLSLSPRTSSLIRRAPGGESAGLALLATIGLSSHQRSIARVLASAVPGAVLPGHGKRGPPLGAGSVTAGTVSAGRARAGLPSAHSKSLAPNGLQPPTTAQPQRGLGRNATAS